MKRTKRHSKLIKQKATVDRGFFFLVITFVFLGFLCVMKDELAKIVLDAEASAYQWYTKEEVKSLNCLRYTYEIIVEAEKQLNLKVTV